MWVFLGQNINKLLLFLLFTILMIAFGIINFLFFHTIIEVWAILVAFSIAIIAWNTKDIIEEDYIYLLGVGYFFIAVLTFLHTFTYEGMAIIADLGPNPPTQFWMAARFLEAFLIYLTAAKIKQKITQKELRVWTLLFLTYTIIVSIGILVIPFFPDALIEGEGLTNFKVIGEYVVMTVLGLAIVKMKQKRDFLAEGVFELLALAIIMSIFAELFFTLYSDVYGITNILGHVFYSTSFYILYRVIVKKSLTKPHTLLYNRLQRAESNLKEINQCFLSLGLDTDKNMDLIVKTAGQLLKADATFYNIIRDDLLKNKSAWNVAEKMKGFSDQAEGHLCDCVVKEDKKEPIVISNLQESSFKESDPAVEEMDLKTYIGFKIKVNNDVVGNLCAVFKEDKEFEQQELDVLSTLGQALELELERKINKEKIEFSMQRAKKLQESLFSQEFPQIPCLDFASVNLQADQVGGDYHDIALIDDKVIFIMIDVTGHGLDAALITVFVSSFFRWEMKNRATIDSALDFLTELDNKFKEQNFPVHYSLEAFVGILDIAELELEYAASGAIRSFLVDADNQPQELENNHGMVINNAIDNPIFGNGKITLGNDDKIIVYTDGLDEPFLFNQDFANDSIKVLKELFAHKDYKDSIQDFVDELLDTTLSNNPALEVKDDISILAIEKSC